MAGGRAASFAWNEAAGRYVDGRGRFVSRADVRRSLDVAVQGLKAELAATGEAFRAGALTLDAWLVETRELVKDVNLFSAALARGGWGQMTQADYGRVGRAVRDQYTYLDRFAADVAAGYPLDGRFVARLKLYGTSGRVLMHEIEGDEAADRGAVEEENILGPTERHCTGTNGCIAQTARGRVPIGELTPIGSRNCLGNCLCRIGYFDADGAEV